MKELDFQSLILGSVRQFGGFGFKMSNRFLIGIPDLFVHLPGLGTSMWEVKAGDMPKKLGTTFIPLSSLQRKTLDDYTKAGGTGGVVSLMRALNHDYVYVAPFEVLAYSDMYVKPFMVSVDSYTELKRGQREEIIVKELRKVYEWKSKNYLLSETRPTETTTTPPALLNSLKKCSEQSRGGKISVQSKKNP